MNPLESFIQKNNPEELLMFLQAWEQLPPEQKQAFLQQLAQAVQGSGQGGLQPNAPEQGVPRQGRVPQEGSGLY